MKIKRGEKLLVRCNRKGKYLAVAVDDFDTLKDEWYPVAVDQEIPVEGLTQTWQYAEGIPCRRGHARIYRRTRATAKEKTTMTELDALVDKLMLTLGAEKTVGRCTEYDITTRLGRLTVIPYKTWIACRFEDVDRAKKHFGKNLDVEVRFNPHTGKWNFTCFLDTSPDWGIAMFAWELSTVLSGQRRTRARQFSEAHRDKALAEARGDND